MHNLRSIVSFINIFDTLLIKVGKNTNISFLPEPIPNSTVHTLVKILNIPLDITIYKHIPIGRGLGGSSSNAGGILGALVKLGLISKEKALQLAPQIGADTTMYLYSSPLLMEGIGDHITPLDHLDIPKRLFLIIPPFSSPTPLIYRAWDEHPTITNYTEHYQHEQIMGNGLSQPFEKVFGIKIPAGSYLTGSGSAMFSQGIPNNIPPNWDIIEINTRNTGWEMMIYEC